MTTMAEAVDDMGTRFVTTWTTTTFPFKYEDVPVDAALQTLIDTGSTPWARLSIKHNKRVQGTLAGPLGSRFDQNGILVIEVYTPSGAGLTKARELGTLLAAAYEAVSVPNGVWYRNVRVEEAAPDGFWAHINVIAEFQYDQVR